MLPCEHKKEINRHAVLFGVKVTEMKANHRDSPLWLRLNALNAEMVLKTTKNGPL